MTCSRHSWRIGLAVPLLALTGAISVQVSRSLLVLSLGLLWPGGVQGHTARPFIDAARLTRVESRPAGHDVPLPVEGHLSYRSTA